MTNIVYYLKLTNPKFSLRKGEMIMENCSNCFFNREGFCCRYPPKVLIYSDIPPDSNPYPHTEFPIAYALYWCGEWKKK